MRSILLLAFCVAVGGAAPASAQSKAVIQKLNDEWVAAFDKGDASALAAMYTEDAYVLPAGADMVKGTNAILTFWGETAKQLGDAKLTTIDVLPLGRTAAREIGIFSFKTKGTPPQEVVGKYAVVWRRVSGQWKLATDIWNMNK
jgi:uncharacterized protein (TIGR02246 family)